MTYPKATTGRCDDARCRPSPAFPELEERVLAFWKADDTFQASVERNPAGENGANEFVFYDGPPFANGLPHYGHLLTGYVKDIVPRYQTMRGRQVERRFGWDCHGLPAELEAMSQLGLKTKDDIEELGHREVQRRLPRVGAALHRRVAGLRHPAGPLGRLRARLQDARPRLHGERALGLQVPVRQGTGLPGPARAALLLERRDAAVRATSCGWTTRSTRDRQDPAVTVGLRLETGELALIWTTTPWTLPSNLAIMVGPDIDYVVVESDGDRHDRALRDRRGAAGRVRRELGDRTRRSGSSSG